MEIFIYPSILIYLVKLMVYIVKQIAFRVARTTLSLRISISSQHYIYYECVAAAGVVVVKPHVY